MSPSKVKANAATGVRAKKAQDTREKILRAAVKVFAKHGYDGGRVEQISKLANSYDRMIYYYFGSKEHLFVEVLETNYMRFNEAEQALKLDPEDPVEALRQLVDFHWNYYLKHPEFAALLSSENTRRGKHAKKSSRLKDISNDAVSVLANVLERGMKKGIFRPDLRARDVFIIITSLGYYYNSNRFTLSAYLGENLMDEQALLHWREVIQHTVLSAVMK